jgi:1,2-phenylacetyl-CoA epoxidase catalytic subunit
MFGRSDSPNVPRFIHWGLKTIGNAQIRDLYKSYVDRKILALGLDLPDERTNRKFL